MRNKNIVIISLHILFWTFNFVRNIIFYKDPVSIILMDQMTIASLCYINYFILIPFILQKNKAWYYFIWFLSFSIIFTFTYFTSWYLTFSAMVNERSFPYSRAITISFLVSVYYGGASTFARLAVEWKINLNKTRELLIQKTNAQIQLMKSNINIPFMLQSLTFAENQAMRSPKDAIQPILQLSNILRYGLYESQSELIELKREIEALNEYIQLHNLIEPQNLLALELENNNEKKFIIPNLLVKSTVNWNFFVQEILKGPQIIKIVTKEDCIEIKFPINNQLDQAILIALFPEIENQKFNIKRESSAHSISLKFLHLHY